MTRSRLTLLIPLALTLSTSPARAQAPTPPNGSKPPVEWLPAHAGNFTPGRSQPIRRIVIHTVEGSLQSAVRFFQSPDPTRRASAHYVVGHDGRVVQMVRDEDTAWHIRNLNADSLGIEHEGWAERDTWTPAQYERSARLVAWLCQTHQIPVDREHIAGHAELPGQTHRADPGPHFDWDRYLALVRDEVRANPVLAPASPADGQVLPAETLSRPLELRWTRVRYPVKAYQVQVEDLESGQRLTTRVVPRDGFAHPVLLPRAGRYRWRVRTLERSLTSGEPDRWYESPWARFELRGGGLAAAGARAAAAGPALSAGAGVGQAGALGAAGARVGQGARRGLVQALAGEQE